MRDTLRGKIDRSKVGSFELYLEKGSREREKRYRKEALIKFILSGVKKFFSSSKLSYFKY